MGVAVEEAGGASPSALTSGTAGDAVDVEVTGVLGSGVATSMGSGAAGVSDCSSSAGGAMSSWAPGVMLIDVSTADNKSDALVSMGVLSPDVEGTGAEESAGASVVGQP